MMNLSSQCRSRFCVLAATGMAGAGLGIAAQAENFTGALVILLFLPLLAVSYFFQYRTSCNIRQMTSVLREASSGNLDARVVMMPDCGDMQEFAQSLNRTLDQSEAFVKEADAAMQYVNKRRYFRSILPTGLHGSYVKYSNHINSALGMMGARDRTLNEFIGYVDRDVKNEAQNVVVSADGMTNQASDIARCVSSTSEQAEKLAAAAASASSNAQAVAAATEEFTSSINEIAEQMSRVANGAEEAVNTVDQACTVMGKLTDASQRIENVVELINKIARQTNLLAMNATIEAARAGEAGKGFSVVAGEVKDLAGQTAKATEEITEQVAAMQSAVAAAQGSIREITGKVSLIGESTVAVASAIEEQRAVTVEISRSITAVSTATAEVSSAVNVVTESARHSNQLTGMVSGEATHLAGKAGEMRQQIDTLLTKLAAA